MKQVNVRSGIVVFVLILLISCTSKPEAVTGPEVVVYEQEPVSEESKVEIVEEKDTEVETPGKRVSFSWEKDSGSRIVDGSVPFIHKRKDGKSRLYYCKDNAILSAISSDGLTFTKESGVRISSGTGFEVQVCDPTIVDLPDGKLRMYYKGANSLKPG